MMAVVTLLLAIAGGTWVGGWWAVPLLAAVWAYLGRVPEWRAGLAAAGAWLLLLLTLPWPALGRLAPRLGGVFGAPGWVALGTVPLFALLLGWSGARLSAALRQVRRAAPSGPRGT